MGRTPGHDAEREETLRGAAQEFAESAGIAHAAAPQVHAQGDGVAVKIENKRCNRRTRYPVESEAKGEGQFSDGMGGFELPVENFFADAGPADFATQGDVD